ncbi:hypothetical protein [Ekhidna sp.]|uniref:hypothetical protein n=1 Tax=Ekhidna sp. TaxID=2608089 RepID=UPI00329A23B6
MKKLLLVSLMIFLTSIAIAQEDSGGISPESGELLIEITSSPFGRDVSSSSSGTTLLNFGQFRARYFLTDALVPRLGVWFSIDDNKGGMSTPDVTQTVSQFMVTPGIEYHFLNENGFTSYAALDVIVTSRSVKQLSETDADIAGALPNPGEDVSSIITENNRSFSFDERGFFGIGAMGAVGADYHFSSRFYMGAEIGFYFVTGKSSDVEIDGTLYQSGIKYFEGGVKTSNSFRIGFKLL